jgi:hypothetical protein
MPFARDKALAHADPNLRRDACLRVEPPRPFPIGVLAKRCGRGVAAPRPPARNGFADFLPRR